MSLTSYKVTCDGCTDFYKFRPKRLNAVALAEAHQMERQNHTVKIYTITEKLTTTLYPAKQEEGTIA